MLRSINVGAGEYPIQGWENIDIHPTAKGVVEADALTFDYSGAVVVYAGHFLEHLSLHQGRNFLRFVWSGLVSGGVLAVTVPAFDRASLASPEIREKMILGSFEWPERRHRSWWSSELLVDTLLELGFKDVSEWNDCPWIAVKVPWQVCVKGGKR